MNYDPNVYKDWASRPENGTLVRELDQITEQLSRIERSIRNIALFNSTPDRNGMAAEISPQSQQILTELQDQMQALGEQAGLAYEHMMESMQQANPHTDPSQRAQFERSMMLGREASRRASFPAGLEHGSFVKCELGTYRFAAEKADLATRPEATVGAELDEEADETQGPAAQKRSHADDASETAAIEAQGAEMLRQFTASVSRLDPSIAAQAIASATSMIGAFVNISRSQTHAKATSAVSESDDANPAISSSAVASTEGVITQKSAMPSASQQPGGLLARFVASFDAFSDKLEQRAVWQQDEEMRSQKRPGLRM